MSNQEMQRTEWDGGCPRCHHTDDIICTDADPEYDFTSHRCTGCGHEFDVDVEHRWYVCAKDVKV